jgi:transposase InsO family protein
MPWKEQQLMKLREEFVLKALEPDASMTTLCKEYGISRKTGYKWVKRFKERGLVGLEELSRRPHASPLRVSGELVLQVLELRRSHARWGPKKLRAVLLRSHPVEAVPSIRTIARILDRAGVSKARRRQRPKAQVMEQPETTVEHPNELWTVDFKGWWKTRDGCRAEPLTVRDQFSRYVLAAELMDSTRAERVREVFERLFERYGLPESIRVDNGSPFASTRSLGGLTTLSAWWVSLGIRVIRGRPSHPEDNGGHERMHLDMRFEVEDVPANDINAQQIALSRWMLEFNFLRPHEALDLQVPNDHYQKSTRLYRGPRRPWYPPGMDVRTVNKKGSVKYRGKHLYVTMALRGQPVGLRQISEKAAQVRYYELDLGTVAWPI